MISITKMLIKYNYSKREDKIKYIVIHDTGNANVGADVKAHYNYFNSANRGASADYFVDDKIIGKFVEDFNKSWHCGDGKNKYGINNNNSIGVELCINSDCNKEVAMENLVELTKFLMKEYNIPCENVVRHFDASKKLCPNSFKANDWALWKEFKFKISTETVCDYMSKVYKNGSTREDVFSDEKLTNKIGSLDPWETCEAIADVNNKIIVLFNTPSGKKTGFVKYRAGL